MTVEDVAFEVCTAVDRAGVVAVLSGGGAATVYASEAPQTKDIDFVPPFVLKSPSEETILRLGFEATRTRGTYARLGTPYTLEFLDGPLAVGEDTIQTWATLRREGQVLHVLTATDCVRDRLAAAIHWNDVASIRQAAAVAKRHAVDMETVRSWCEAEEGTRVFANFLGLLRR